MKKILLFIVLALAALHAPAQIDSLRAFPDSVSADSVIRAYIEVIGGREVLEEIKAVTINMKATTEGQTFTLDVYREKPDKFAMELREGPIIRQKEVYDGRHGYKYNMTTLREVEGNELKDMQAFATFNFELYYKELDFEARAEYITAIEGREAYRVAMVSPTGKTDYWFFDVETGFRIMTLEEVETDIGQRTIETRFEDYVSEYQVFYPRIITQTIGKQTIVMEVTHIDNQSRIRNSVFKMDENLKDPNAEQENENEEAEN